MRSIHACAMFYGIKSIQLKHEFRNKLANIYANVDDDDNNNPDIEIMKSRNIKILLKLIHRIYANAKHTKKKTRKQKRINKQMKNRPIFSLSLFVFFYFAQFSNVSHMLFIVKRNNQQLISSKRAFRTASIFCFYVTFCKI